MLRAEGPGAENRQALGWSEPTGNRREQTTRGQTLGGLKADDAELQKTLSPTLEISDG